MSMALTQGLFASVGLHLAVAATCYSLGTFSPPQLSSTGAGSVFKVTLSKVTLSSDELLNAGILNAAVLNVGDAVKNDRKDEILPAREEPATHSVASKSESKKLVLKAPAAKVAKLSAPDKAVATKTLEAPSAAALVGSDSKGSAASAESNAFPPQGMAGSGTSGNVNRGGVSPGGAPGDGPSILRSPKPAYPPLARRANFEGRVVLDIVIAPTGEVSEAKIAQSSGREDCDLSAKETVLSRWEFKPARLNGVNVAWRERVAVSYRLR